MNIALIVKPGHLDSGVGRYAQELEGALRAAGHQVSVVHPHVPLPGWLLGALRRWPGWDLQAFLMTYPLWVRYPPADIYHFTSQNLASLLFLRRPRGKVVVTVHDIIPWLVRNDPELCLYRNFIERRFDRLAYRQLKRVDFILTDSEFSKQSMADEFGISAEKIKTVLLGIY